MSFYCDRHNKSILGTRLCNTSRYKQVHTGQNSGISWFHHWKKNKKIYKKCSIVSIKPKLTIREFDSFIGTLTSSFSGNEFGALYYRATLKVKDKSLKCDKGIINAIRKLSENTLHEISWWK